MADYIDKVKIREGYESMHDDQLLLFAEKEGLGLTSDAFLILREVLQSRNIGTEIIAKLEREIILKHSLNFKRMEEDFNNELLIKAYKTAFRLKADKKSDFEIHNALQEIGINTEYAYKMAKNMRGKLIELNDSASNETVVGLVIGGVGLLLVYISFQMERFVLPAFMALIFVIIRAVVSANRKKRYQEILAIIDEEGQDSIETPPLL